MTPDGRPRDGGLQPERTALAWTRTSLGMLGNAGLLALRDVNHYGGSLRILPAALALLLAAGTYVAGLHRGRTLRKQPLPTPLAARGPIRWIGTSVVILVLVAAIAFPV